MALSKLVTKAIKDAEIKTDNIAPANVTTAKIGPNAVESSEINNGTVTAADLASSLDLSPKTTTLPSGTISFDKEYFNIALLGFKMAVNESLTVFNLIDGIVDEFHDESGTDESESSNDTYCASGDFYKNVSSACISAGFTVNSITEPQTSAAGTNPAYETGTFGTFTVPSGMTSANLYVFGAGGGNKDAWCSPSRMGGGGGFASGTLAVTASQVLHIGAGEGGRSSATAGADNSYGGFLNGGGGSVTGLEAGYDPAAPQNSQGGSGGGLAGVFAVASPTLRPASTPQAPSVYMVAGSGGGGGTQRGGAGGGLTGLAGTNGTAQTNNDNPTSSSGGGGDQEQGGQGGTSSQPGGHNPWGPSGQSGSFLTGGNGGTMFGDGGGAGYYGGGGSGNHPQQFGGAGGGSSYYGHPQITSGATEAGGGSPYPCNAFKSGGEASPVYPGICSSVPYTIGDGKNDTNPPGTSTYKGNPVNEGQDGYVLITGTYNVAGTSTIVSEAFAANSVPTTSRIVVFEENVDTPTLNTDIIASISRDGGSNYTTATLADSGYVTGSSGQRILTGQATISGQPSGQSMRWKLALANNQVKIHGVSLSWA